MTKSIHDALLVVLGFMLVVIVSDNSALFASVQSKMLYPAFIVSVGVIGLKIQMRIDNG
tara:strand:+ start:50 stop:226 length:177 start_codon:yes stop_codon:yes gene_type:complete